MTIDLASLTYPQQLEIRRIQVSAGVVPDSVAFDVGEGGEQRLSFDLRSEPTVAAPHVDIRDIERVHFVYRQDRRFGETAPTSVVCDREDFPRDIGHLCAGPPGCSAAPCLAIGGMQPIYERAGIEALLVRLRDFMRDAKTGSLMAGGWEPVPFAVEQSFCPGEVDPKFFQNYAYAHPTERIAYGVAINIEHDEARYVIVFPESIPLESIIGAIGHRNAASDDQPQGLRGVPWIFLWPERCSGETAPVFQAWRTGAEFREGLQHIGVLAAFDEAVVGLLHQGVTFNRYRPPLGGKALVVVIGVWRPSPIMPDFFGYSDDPEARHLELRAYLITQSLMGNIVDDTTTVESIVGDYPPRPELLRWVSGTSDLPPIAMLGVGALGSAVFNHLVRAGIQDAIIQDHDRLHAHNLARHTGRTTDVYRFKTKHAEQLMRHVAQNGSTTVATVEDSISTTPVEILRDRFAGRLVIDATADEAVRLKMDELRAVCCETIIRTEMFHEGRLGVTFVCRAMGPTFSDMMLSLIARAVDEPSIASWLDYEMQHPLGPDPMLYGFGCTSQTVHLPNYVVEQHASVAAAAIVDVGTVSGIGINPLDHRHRPLGWRWLPVEPFTLFVPSTAKEWTVRLSNDARSFLERERLAALPAETGGYLYGNWDAVRRTITIIAATPLPPQSIAGPTLLILGPAGHTREEKRLLRKTRGRLFLCGTWHSHPNRKASMSGRDHRAMTLHQESDAPCLRPTLIMIVAEGDIQAHMKVT